MERLKERVGRAGTGAQGRGVCGRGVKRCGGHGGGVTKGKHVAALMCWNVHSQGFSAHCRGEAGDCTWRLGCTRESHLRRDCKRGWCE